MDTNRLGSEQNPLKRFKIDNDEDLIRKLNIAQLWTEHCKSDISKAIALRRPSTCSTIRGRDVEAIFRYLEDHPKWRKNHCERLRGMKAQDKHGDGFPEVQDALREWDFDIDMVKRK